MRNLCPSRQTAPLALESQSGSSLAAILNLPILIEFHAQHLNCSLMYFTVTDLTGLTCPEQMMDIRQRARIAHNQSVGDLKRAPLKEQVD